MQSEKPAPKRKNSGSKRGCFPLLKRVENAEGDLEAEIVGKTLDLRRSG